MATKDDIEKIKIEEIVDSSAEILLALGEEGFKEFKESAEVIARSYYGSILGGYPRSSEFSTSKDSTYELNAFGNFTDYRDFSIRDDIYNGRLIPGESAQDLEEIRDRGGSTEIVKSSQKAEDLLIKHLSATLIGGGVFNLEHIGNADPQIKGYFDLIENSIVTEVFEGGRGAADLQKAIREALRYGIGCIHTGVKNFITPKGQLFLSTEQLQQLGQEGLKQLIAQKKAEGSKIINYEDKGIGIISYDSIQKPFLTHLNDRNVLFPKRASDKDNMRTITILEIMLADDLLKYGVFPETVTKLRNILKITNDKTQDGAIYTFLTYVRMDVDGDGVEEIYEIIHCKRNTSGNKSSTSKNEDILTSFGGSNGGFGDIVKVRRVKKIPIDFLNYETKYSESLMSPSLIEKTAPIQRKISLLWRAALNFIKETLIPSAVVDATNISDQSLDNLKKTGISTIYPIEGLPEDKKLSDIYLPNRVAQESFAEILNAIAKEELELQLLIGVTNDSIGVNADKLQSTNAKGIQQVISSSEIALGYYVNNLSVGLKRAIKTLIEIYIYSLPYTDSQGQPIVIKSNDPNAQGIPLTPELLVKYLEKNIRISIGKSNNQILSEPGNLTAVMAVQEKLVGLLGKSNPMVDAEALKNTAEDFLRSLNLSGGIGRYIKILSPDQLQQLQQQLAAPPPPSEQDKTNKAALGIQMVTENNKVLANNLEGILKVADITAKLLDVKVKNCELDDRGVISQRNLLVSDQADKVIDTLQQFAQFLTTNMQAQAFITQGENLENASKLVKAVTQDGKTPEDNVGGQGEAGQGVPQGLPSNPPNSSVVNPRADVRKKTA
jgi:hypothetical protein